MTKNKEKGVPEITTGTTISLGIMDRLLIRPLAPLKGDFKTLAISESIIDSVGLTVEEMNSVNLRIGMEDFKCDGCGMLHDAKTVSELIGSSGVKWDDKKEEKLGKKKIKFSLMELELLQEKIEEAEKNKEIDMVAKKLFKRIVDIAKEKTKE